MAAVEERVSALPADSRRKILLGESGIKLHHLS